MAYSAHFLNRPRADEVPAPTFPFRVRATSSKGNTRTVADFRKMADAVSTAKAIAELAGTIGAVVIDMSDESTVIYDSALLDHYRNMGQGGDAA